MSLIIIYNYRTLGRPGLTLQRLTLSSLVQRVWLLQIQLILSSGLALMRDSKLKSLKSRLPFSFPKDTFFFVENILKLQTALWRPVNGI